MMAQQSEFYDFTNTEHMTNVYPGRKKGKIKRGKKNK